MNASSSNIVTLCGRASNTRRQLASRSYFSPLLKCVAQSCAIVLGLATLTQVSRAQYAIQELVGGLNYPRGITFGPDGALYIAEAGAPFKTDANTPFTVDRGVTEYYGTTGAIVKYSNNTLSSVLTNLPMLDNVTTGEITGVHGLAFNSAGDLFFTLGLGADPAARVATPLASLGQLMRLPSGGGVAVSFADLSSIETLSNPAGGLFDSNPYHLLSLPGGFLATDAGGNDVLQISSSGAVSVKAILASVVPSGAEPVPTSVVSVGGNLFVSELTGFPFPVGGSSVFRLDGSTPVPVATGFTNVIDMAAGPDGMLYLLEYAQNGIRSGDTSGALWEVNPLTGAKSLLLDQGLTSPSAIAVGANGTIYIANNGLVAGAGEILAVTPVPEPATYGIFGGAALLSLILARKKRSQRAKREAVSSATVC